MGRDKPFQTLRINASARSVSCVCNHAVFVGGRKKFVEAMNVVCTACIYTGAVFFHLFPKIKRGMDAVSSVATQLHVYMLRTCSAVILVLAINSLKM